MKKMELNATVDNFSKEERNNMRARLAMLDNKEHGYSHFKVGSKSKESISVDNHSQQ